MNVELPILGYAVAGVATGLLPEVRSVELPQLGFRGRKPRLPTLAVELSRRAQAEHDLPATTSVYFGTALGCLSETEAFVMNMIRAEETGPIPRAFSASVHNAIASSVAICLGARGENQTFVHGELSFHQAVLATARGRMHEGQGPAIVGALDEWTPFVERARLVCGATGEPSEGGAVLLLGELGDVRPLAILERVAFAKPTSKTDWIRRQLAGLDVDRVLVGPMKEPGLDGLGRSHVRWTGDHPSAAASAAAIGIGMITGEARTEGTLCPIERLAIVTASRFSEVGLLVLRRAQDRPW